MPGSPWQLRSNSKITKCLHDFPYHTRRHMLAIMLLQALRQGLLAYSDTQVQGPSRLVVEEILGDLVDLHKSHLSFRKLLRSQSATGILVEYLPSSPGNSDPKGAIGKQVSPTQKQQILKTTKAGSQPTSHAVTFSSSRLASVHEDALRKSSACLEEWRNTTIASGRKHYRKTFIDL
ncbi:hypothetical protein OG21DRAFT_1488986 [Imleria badia]|nr:hypothetical protein OG21DRAFT_1488986 [Imleria badia]